MSATMDQTGPLLLSGKQVAKLLGVSENSVKNFEERGGFPKSIKIGCLRKWRLSDVQNYIDAGGTQAGRAKGK